jgi:hypothetical protein
VRWGGGALCALLWVAASAQPTAAADLDTTDASTAVAEVFSVTGRIPPNLGLSFPDATASVAGGLRRSWARARLLESSPHVDTRPVVRTMAESSSDGERRDAASAVPVLGGPNVRAETPSGRRAASEAATGLETPSAEAAIASSLVSHVGVRRARATTRVAALRIADVSIDGFVSAVTIDGRQAKYELLVGRVRVGQRTVADLGQTALRSGGAIAETVRRLNRALASIDSSLGALAPRAVVRVLGPTEVRDRRRVEASAPALLVAVQTSLGSYGVVLGRSWARLATASASAPPSKVLPLIASSAPRAAAAPPPRAAVEPIREKRTSSSPAPPSTRRHTGRRHDSGLPRRSNLAVVVLGVAVIGFAQQVGRGVLLLRSRVLPEEKGAGLL